MFSKVLGIMPESVLGGGVFVLKLVGVLNVLILNSDHF